MPPRRYSRHTYALGFNDRSGPTPEVLMLTERTPFLYRAYDDTRQHVVGAGETLWNLAAKYYAAFQRPAGLWWVIADFQPDPIHDPTIALEPGTILYIPSSRTLTEEIFSASRYKESDK